MSGVDDTSCATSTGSGSPTRLTLSLVNSVDGEFSFQGAKSRIYTYRANAETWSPTAAGAGQSNAMVFRLYGASVNDAKISGSAQSLLFPAGVGIASGMQAVGAQGRKLGATVLEQQ